MEAIGKKGNASKKLRSLAQMGLARASSFAALLAGAQVFTNALQGAAQIQPFSSTPPSFPSTAGRTRSYLVIASINTSTNSAVDLTASVQLLMDGSPLVVAPQAPVGLGIGGHTDLDTSRVTLFWIVTFPGATAITGLHSFGIQSDIGGGNTHVLPAGHAEVLVLELV